MADKFPQPLSGMVVPRFGEVATFMRLPVERDPKKLDIAIVGVPWDGGTTNRPGARHGPREIRNMSTLMRRVHHVSLVAPYELCRVGDHGDALAIEDEDAAARIGRRRAVRRKRVQRSYVMTSPICVPGSAGGWPRSITRAVPICTSSVGFGFECGAGGSGGGVTSAAGPAFATIAVVAGTSS